jgi:hypothetical protein
MQDPGYSTDRLPASFQVNCDPACAHSCAQLTHKFKAVVTSLPSRLTDNPTSSVEFRAENNWFKEKEVRAMFNEATYDL